MKLYSKLKPAAALATIVLLTGYAGSVFADDAAVSYLPPVQARPAVPKDPVKAQRKTEQKAERAADRHFATNVRKAIIKAGGVDASHMSVVAKSGAITLEGSVPEAAQIDLAQQHAQQVAGVTGVTNRLSLATSGH
ncbi:MULTISPECIES: BON domain-containing protein [Paraburkholderia]|uniref:Osmotically-inducible protein OsmY n=1 Tax=Paraburkholderia youngii TaxID=2782701 RepID=A0A7W8L731_9BURK|nr:BON domain-containing protein [Paraburkholderia youngii]MBB5401616.1 osmotically-inducible protein OsmY [Paraburkholderia youngii]